MVAQTVDGRRHQNLHEALADLIDFGHLERYTMGEPALTQELLRMFCDELRLFELGRHEDPAVQRRAVHRLKGAARAVGAFPLAEAAEWLETLLVEEAPQELLADARMDLQVQLDALRDACKRWKQANGDG